MLFLDLVRACLRARPFELCIGRVTSKIIATLALLTVLVQTIPAADKSYLTSALDAANWIRSSAIQLDQGKVWPADPLDVKSVNDTLYAGIPGVILFFLEAYHSTVDRTLLNDARAGADHY